MTYRPGPGLTEREASGAFAPIDPSSWAPGKAAFRPWDTQTYVAFGDSITARGGPTVNGVSTYYQSDGYISWMQQKLRHPIALLANAGVSGNTTTQMLARIQTDVLAKQPGHVVGMAGVNDLISSSNAVNDAAAVIANLDSMFTQMTAAGITIWWSTILPCDNATTTGRQAITIVNQWLKRNSRGRKNLHVIDGHAVCVDPANGLYLANNTTDGTHPNTLSARKIGHAFATVMAPFFTAGDTLSRSPLDPRQILVNPMQTGTTGTLNTPATGQVGTNWNLGPLSGTTGTCAGSKVASSDDFAGEWQQITVSDAGAAGFQYYQTVTTQTLWAPGDGFLYYPECEFQLDPGYTNPGNTGRAGIQISLIGQNSGFTTQVSSIDINMQQDAGPKGGAYTYGFPASPAISSGILRGPAVAIPATVTRFQVVITVNLICTLRVRGVSGRRLLTTTDT